MTNKLSQVASLLLIRYFFFTILDKRKAKEIVTPSLSEHTLYMYVYLCRRLQLGLPIKYLSTDFGALKYIFRKKLSVKYGQLTLGKKN